MRIRNWVFVLCAGLLAGFGSLPIAAEDGVSPKEIKLGMVNALTGPASALGNRLRAGAFAYFMRLNRGEGVHGRKVQLVSLDDGYEPDRTVAMTRKLIEQDKVFALIGYVGTPTCVAALPLAVDANVPFVGPFTGAEALRTPLKKPVFHIRASYFDETEGLVERFTKDLGITKIGILIQDDAFGAAGEAGVLRALGKRKLTLAGKGVFKRNTMDVDAGLAELQKAAPEAVIMVGPYTPLVAFVKRSLAKGFRPKFATISFVGTESLIKNLGTDSEGLLISQVMPSPHDARNPLIKQYQTDLAATSGGEPDYGSLEGYVDALVFTSALKSAGAEPTRAGFVAAMENLNLDLGQSMRVHFSPNIHQGLRWVYFTRAQGGKAVQITKF